MGWMLGNVDGWTCIRTRQLYNTLYNNDIVAEGRGAGMMDIGVGVYIT